ncbi:MAG: hypothetical protein V1794_12210 [Candidatus Glassbacteria bacterium]
MESVFLLLAAVGCLPSLFYVAYLVLKRMKRRLRGWLPGDGLTQVLLVAVSVFCFSSCLLMVVWNFATPVPYFHLEKALIIALLFLLMGILCLQVLQFIRLQNRPYRSAMNIPRRTSAGNSRKVARPYAVSNSKN